MRILIQKEDIDLWHERIDNIRALINEAEDIIGEEFQTSKETYDFVGNIDKFLELTNSSLHMLLSKIKK